jgi:hypothetical protein
VEGQPLFGKNFERVKFREQGEPLTIPEQKALAKRFKDGDQEAKTILAERYHGAIQKIASTLRIRDDRKKKPRTKKYHIDFKDLVSAGFIGFFEGVGKYNLDRPETLWTFCQYWVLKRIMEEVEDRLQFNITRRMLPRFGSVQTDPQTGGQVIRMIPRLKFKLAKELATSPIEEGSGGADPDVGDDINGEQAAIDVEQGVILDFTTRKREYDKETGDYGLVDDHVKAVDKAMTGDRGVDKTEVLRWSSSTGKWRKSGKVGPVGTKWRIVTATVDRGWLFEAVERYNEKALRQPPWNRPQPLVLVDKLSHPNALAA